MTVDEYVKTCKKLTRKTLKQINYTVKEYELSDECADLYVKMLINMLVKSSMFKGVTNTK